MDHMHFTAARNAGLDGHKVTETDFYDTHSFETWHRFIALLRRIMARPPVELRRVQVRRSKLKSTHAN